jgi:hypothetical protein
LIRLLISAGTEFTDQAWTFHFLDRVHAERDVAAVLHTPTAEALARDWAAARGIPHGPAPGDLAGVDVVAALPGPVPARVYQLGGPVAKEPKLHFSSRRPRVEQLRERGAFDPIIAPSTGGIATDRSCSHRQCCQKV